MWCGVSDFIIHNDIAVLSIFFVFYYQSELELFGINCANKNYHYYRLSLNMKEQLFYDSADSHLEGQRDQVRRNILC